MTKNEKQQKIQSQADAIAALRFQKRAWYKKFLPRALFARTILIIVIPVVLMQIIAAWIFYNNHWNAITDQQVHSVVAEIGMVIDQVKEYDTPEARIAIFASARNRTDFFITYQPDGVLGNPTTHLFWDPFLIKKLNTALQSRISYPFRVNPNFANKWIEIYIALPDGGILETMVPLDRIYTPTTHIFLLWLFGSSIALFTISILFMRNQIRPIRRLAIAAEKFGKGRDVQEFKLEGATEVRQAAMAFLNMRARIQKQIEQRTELLAGVSHDLRTPLTRMKLQFSLWEDNQDVKDLRNDIREMEALIQAYLDFASGDKDEAEIATPFSEMLEDIANNAKRSGLDVTTNIEKNITLPLRPIEMRRCINNLISNARRYGNGKVWISAQKRIRRIEITIEDNGKGIKDDDAENVFKPFIRLEESRNQDTGGIGLGLSIARDIARRHGGEITLTHSPHKGLKAIITLPI